MVLKKHNNELCALTFSVEKGFVQTFKETMSNSHSINVSILK